MLQLSHQLLLVALAGEASRIWSRVCQDRWKLDVECRHLVSEMCWPLRQATALRRLVELNVLILEVRPVIPSPVGNCAFNRFV